MTNINSKILLASPSFVVLAGQLAIRALAPTFGAWSWAPFVAIYVAILFTLCFALGERTAFRDWLGPSRGRLLWRILAVVVPPLLTLPILLPNWQLMLTGTVFLSTLVFSLVNPIAEEFYWRAALLDAAKKWPAWLAISYSTFFFALHHLWLGVIAPAGQHPSALAGPILMGIVWSLSYYKSKSLRWPLAGHALTNFMSLSVPVFMGQYVPP